MKATLQGRAKKGWKEDSPGLVPWPEVARRFNEKFGEEITAGGAWHIFQQAMKKAMASVKREEAQ